MSIDEPIQNVSAIFSNLQHRAKDLKLAESDPAASKEAGER
jgi:hypothetical protein